MHVVATAGHVDHGKSTLVRALTGQRPRPAGGGAPARAVDRARLRWTSLPTVGDVAFVDVPGHERFISTMLAGVGPVPAVLFVVAADDPWMPQAAEHLAALDALGVAHGVVAVTRADLADPAPAAGTGAGRAGAAPSLAGAPVVAVSGRTGDGLDELRIRAGRDGRRRCPRPTRTPTSGSGWTGASRVSGAGTVVTGTLPAGHRIASATR